MGKPVSELEQWPSAMIREYRALNYLMPFTEDAQAHRDGIVIQSLVNQNVSKKKDLMKADQILSYLKAEPDWIIHPTIKKVNGLIDKCKTPEAVANLMKSVLEEIDIERNKSKPDDYLIQKLIEFYHKHKAA